MLKLFRNCLFSKLISVVLSILLLSLSGCYYYKVSPSEQIHKEDLSRFHSLNKKVYVHYGDEVWNFYNILIDDEILIGQISEIEQPLDSRVSIPGKTKRYYPTKKAADAALVNNVHIYISEYSKKSDQRISILPDAIEKVEIFDKDSGATISSWIFSGLLAVVGAAAVLFLILILSSCPFVYVWDGESYVFTGEIYSGAIQAALERHDYLPLNDLVQENGTYSIKIKNELKEIQHTNLAELLVFEHPDNLQVLVDKYGVYHTINDPVSPIEANSLSGLDILNVVSEKDSVIYSGNLNQKEMTTNDGIILKFQVPKDADKADLIVNAKNSFWLDYLFTKFHDMFGENYSKFQEKQKNAGVEDMNSWYTEQNLPLSVFIEESGEWVKKDHYNLVGPMAFKDDVLQIDVSQYKGKEISIKLESGFMFWEVDFVGLDYSPDIKLKQKRLSIQSAIDNKGLDVSSLMIADDNEYYIQRGLGDEATLTFAAPAAGDKSQTIVLHSKGYYLILRDQEGKPDKKTLREFRKKDRLPQYSIELIKEFQDSRKRTLNSKN